MPSSPRKPRRVDIDNLEQVFEGFGATLKLPSPNPADAPVPLDFCSLDDFHPDSLLQRVPFLSNLISARSGLVQPGQEADAAGKLAAILRMTSTPAPSPSAQTEKEDSQQAPATESDDATLGRLLGRSPSATPSDPPKHPLSVVEKLVHQAVASSGSITPSAPSGTEGLLSAADLELSTRLRGVLNDCEFQSLEAAWRSLDFLIRRCPDEECVQYSVLDARLDELTHDIESFKRLLRDTPPRVLLVDHQFGQTESDLRALESLAVLCSELGVRLIAGGHPSLAGCDSFAMHSDPEEWRQEPPSDVADSWSNLRSSPAAACVGLALPRFLLRQPYGQGSDPVDRFGFEEISNATDHDAFLWGNAAFLCAQVLAETFVAQAEGMDAGDDMEVDDLPVFHYKQDGESAMKPCAEAWLTDRVAETLLRRGLIPVLSIKGRNAVSVATFISIAKLA